MSRQDELAALDDMAFALTCARKNARTDKDAGAIAWAEERIEDLEKQREGMATLVRSLESNSGQQASEISRLQARVAELEKRNGELVERASAIFDKRKGAYGTCLIDRGEVELSRDLEHLRALLDGDSK